MAKNLMEILPKLTRRELACLVNASTYHYCREDQDPMTLVNPADLMLMPRSKAIGDVKKWASYEPKNQAHEISLLAKLQEALRE